VEVREREVVLVKVEAVEVGWEEHAPGQDPAGAVSVLIVEPRLPIKQESPALT